MSEDTSTEPQKSTLLDRVMSTLVFVGVGAATIWGLQAFVQSHQERVKELKSAEKELRASLEEKNVFEITPVKGTLDSKNSLGAPWYYNYTHTIVEDGKIVYDHYDDLYVKGNAGLSKRKVLVKDADVFGDYLFTADVGGEPHVTWIDDSKNLQTFAYSDPQTVNSYPLAHYFDSIPNHVEVGDVNDDGNIDLLYVKRIKVASYFRDAIYLAYGGDEGFSQPEMAYYPGEDSIEKLVVRDFDGDGDSDILYKIVTSDKRNSIFGVENLTHASDKKGDFELAIKDNTDLYMIGFLYLMMLNG